MWGAAGHPACSPVSSAVLYEAAALLYVDVAPAAEVVCFSNLTRVDVRVIREGRGKSSRKMDESRLPATERSRLCSVSWAPSTE